MRRPDEPPRQQVPFGIPEWSLIGLGLLSAAGLIVTWILTWPLVPENIPPELPVNWSTRRELMIVPILGLKFYLIIAIFAAVPEMYNYGWKITEENRRLSYRIGRCFTLALALVPLWGCFAGYLALVRMAARAVA